MASRVAATAAKAIYAEPAFVPKGPINAGRFNLIREIAIGFTLGLTGGMMWKVSVMLGVHSLPASAAEAECV